MASSRGWRRASIGRLENQPSSAASPFIRAALPDQVSALLCCSIKPHERTGNARKLGGKKKFPWPGNTKKHTIFTMSETFFKQDLFRRNSYKHKNQKVLKIKTSFKKIWSDGQEHKWNQEHSETFELKARCRNISLKVL